MNYSLSSSGPQLRDYQLEASEAVFNFYSQPRKLDENGFPIRRNPLICLPTGTGKSLCIADIIRRAFAMVPQTRAVMATHVKELIKQNAGKLQEAWPLAPLGIYSAGLDARDNIQPVIYGGIRSMVGKYPMFGFRDFLLIDEAHLLSPNSDTSYMTFINELMYGPDFDGKLTLQVFERAVANPNCNPYLKVIGFTATPYRLGLGLMTNGPIFTDIVYDLCNIDGFLRLMANGYLCPLISHSKDKAGKALVELDTSGVGLGSDGDFAQGALQEAVDKSPITYAAIKQMVEEGQDRASWLIFASGIKHAEHIGEMLNSFGISNVVIHSKTTGNDKLLEQWKQGKVRAAVNMNALTTGIDHPPCDYIGVLRPTKSTGLWCLDAKTEILTKNGFKFKDEINVDDIIATVNSETMQVEYLPVIGKIERTITEDESFVSFQSPQMDWRVSDKHRMLRRLRFGRDRSKTKPDFATAASLLSESCIELPVSGNGHNIDLPLSDAELRFIGLFMTDGSLDKTNKQITIYQSKRYPEVLNSIRICFEQCGFKAREYSKQRPPYFDIHRFQVAYGNWKHLENYLSKDFALPLMELSERQFDILMESIYWGDGQKQPSNVNWTQRSFHISTGNELFAERLQQTGLVNGYRATLTKSHVYYIRLKKQQWNTISKSSDGRNQIEQSVSKGEIIWCIENANGTLFTRRNGKVVIVGNCQMLGRGTRPFDWYNLSAKEQAYYAHYAGFIKSNCKVMDFARNTRTLGPINDPVIPRLKGSGPPGDSPVKICDCGVYNHASSRYCIACGNEFPFSVNINKTASTDAVMKSDLPQIESLDVKYMVCGPHTSKKSGQTMIRVAIFCGLRTFYDHMNFESPIPFVRHKARDWFRQIYGEPPEGLTNDGALALAKSFRNPARIRIWLNKNPQPEIQAYEF